MEKGKFKIWYQTRDERGNITGTGVCNREYCYYGTAHNAAYKRFGDREDVEFEVAVLNPFIEHFQDAVCDICGKVHSRPINATFGHAFMDHHMYITSSAIAPTDGRKRFSKGYETCPDCVVKIKNFVDSLKGTSGCTWSDGLGTAPDGTQCGECDPSYAERCPHLKEGKDDENTDSI